MSVTFSIRSVASPSGRIIRHAADNLVWVLLLLSLLVFSIAVDGFFNTSTYINILSHSVFIGILAIAITFPLIGRQFDLSVESVAGLGAIVSAWLAGTSTFASGLHLNPFLALIVVMAIGAIVGLVNSFFVVHLSINSFLVTLATYIIVRGLAVLLTNGSGVSLLPDSFRWIDRTDVLGVPLTVYLMLGLYALFSFVLRATVFGRHLFVIGGNPGAAYNFGVNVKAVLTKAFVLSGVLAGLTGWLIAARSNGATPAVASGFLFETIAAVVIGGVSLSGGYGSLRGVLGGVLLLSSLTTALNILAVSPFVTDVVRGFLVLAAVVLDSARRFTR